MTKKSAMEERQERLEQSFEDLSWKVRTQNAHLQEWMEKMELRLQKDQRRRQGRSHRSGPREVSGETMEPATVHITMRKSEEVEEKVVANDWEGEEKNYTFDKEPDEDTFDAVRSFIAPVYDTYPDEEETKSRIDWGMDLASDKAPPPEENADEATADAVVPDRDMREGTFSLSVRVKERRRREGATRSSVTMNTGGDHRRRMPVE